jgi:hypothetical protein
MAGRRFAAETLARRPGLSYLAAAPLHVAGSAPGASAPIAGEPSQGERRLTIRSEPDVAAAR